MDAGRDQVQNVKIDLDPLEARRKKELRRCRGSSIYCGNVKGLQGRFRKRHT
jgi:hypothetical protein